jgi:hypothetical protein
MSSYIKQLVVTEGCFDRSPHQRGQNTFLGRPRDRTFAARPSSASMAAWKRFGLCLCEKCSDPFVGGQVPKQVPHVSWGAIASATTYTLQMLEPQTGPAQTVEYTGSGTSWSAAIFYSGEVEFRLQACNSVGCSAWSAEQSVILQN